MAATVKPVSSVQTLDGNVVGTFQLLRDGRPGVQFSLTIPGNSTQEDIGKLVATKAISIADHEPANALAVLEQMTAAGQSWTMPDAPA